MLIVPSPLVSSMSGKTAGLVAASWKGRQYVRRYVIPHNPQSAGQTAVRESLARCVTLWRSLSSIVKTSLNSYGADYRMSGYNTFMSKNRAAEQVPALLKPVPDNPHVPAPNTPAFAAGGAGEIDFTWVDNSGDTCNQILLYCRKDDGSIFNAFAIADANALTITVSGLDTGEDYDCYAWFHYSGAPKVVHGTVAGELAVTAG